MGPCSLGVFLLEKESRPPHLATCRARRGVVASRT